MLMIVMFILMALPLIALPVFWLLPLGQAILVYLLSLLLSAWMFWLMRRNKKYRVVTGREGLIGQEAEVVSTSIIGGKPAFTVSIEGELWTARSNDAIQPGEKVVITASEGNTLVIKRKDDNVKSRRE
jgi:membrane protein implicated in regulation of membrane protease activity